METFMFTLPIVSGTQRSRDSAQMNQLQPHQGRKRILAVDDEPDLTRVYSLALQYHGFKVDTFNDSEEVLSNFKPDYYDLVILDIKMPNMDGFELYDEIKKKESDDLLCFTASGLYYEELERKNICI